MKSFTALSICVLLFMRLSACTGKAAREEQALTPIKTDKVILQDSTGKEYFKFFFNDRRSLAQLNFPAMSMRLYKSRDFNHTWFDAGVHEKHVFAAMRMLSSVGGYGLNADDYHPDEISYTHVKTILADFARLPLTWRTDIFLTDAFITFIVQLHFGFANQKISQTKLDTDTSLSFRAEKLLLKALDGDFEQNILSAQPRDPDYKSLQSFMRNELARYSGNDSKKEDTLRLLALNLERYRWQNLEDSFVVAINIPSFTLKFWQGNKVDSFRVIIGKPSSPTPVLISQIRYFDTAPDWNVPSSIFIRELLPKMLRDPSYARRNNFAIYNRHGKYIEPDHENLALVSANPSAYYARQSYGCDNALGQIVFHFNNPYSVYLHDTPEQKYFKASYRALSHGCIRVQYPKKLVSLLLESTGAAEGIYLETSDAMDHYRKFRYSFHQPVPIVIRYITCGVQGGQLRIYEDIYKRDQKLMKDLFSSVNFIGAH